MVLNVFGGDKENKGDKDKGKGTKTELADDDAGNNGEGTGDADDVDGGGGNPNAGNAGDAGDLGDDDGPPYNYDVERFTGIDEYPDNEFTRLLPRPDFPIDGGYTGKAYFTFFAEKMSAADAKAYVEQLKSAGFNKEVLDSDEDDMYMFTGQNGDGYSVFVVWFPDAGGTVSIEKG